MSWSPVCKGCRMLEQRVQRECDPLPQRRADRKYRDANRAKRAAACRAWRERYRDRRQAHKIVERALAAGTLERRACWCGEPGQAHHADYAKPLEVEWLCARHHGRRHTLAGKAGETVREATEPGE